MFLQYLIALEVSQAILASVDVLQLSVFGGKGRRVPGGYLIGTKGYLGQSVLLLGLVNTLNTCINIDNKYYQ